MVSKPATQASTARPRTSGARAKLPRMASHAPTGAIGQGQAEDQVREGREALRVRVAEDDGEGHRRERQAQRVQHRRGQHEQRPRTRTHEGPDLAPRRSTPRGSSRPAVRGLRASIAWSARRLKPMAALRAPTIATTIQPSWLQRNAVARGERGRGERERQREDRVRELDHPAVGHGALGKRLAPPLDSPRSLAAASRVHYNRSHHRHPGGRSMSSIRFVSLGPRRRSHF